MDPSHRLSRPNRLPAFTLVVLSAAVLMLPTPSAWGQSFRDRMEHLRRSDAAESTRQERQRALAEQRIAFRLSQPLPVVNMRAEPFRDALNRWREMTGVDVVIHWQAMELAGISGEEPITLTLREVPAARVLGLMLRQAGQPVAELDPDARLMADLTPWYVEVLTRGQLNRRAVVKVYAIESLVMPVTDFTDAPSLNLSDALSDLAGEGGGSGVFENAEDADEDGEAARDEAIENIVDLIRTTVEPELWLANGGEVASLRENGSRLVIRAPQYVHDHVARLIGPAVIDTRHLARWGDASAQRAAAAVSASQDRGNGEAGAGPGSRDRAKASRVSGVNREADRTSRVKD